MLDIIQGLSTVVIFFFAFVATIRAYNIKPSLLRIGFCGLTLITMLFGATKLLGINLDNPMYIVRDLTALLIIYGAYRSK